ncbi:MAG: hypothetical protein U0X92_02265 [Anaerolineales bacterium]
MNRSRFRLRLDAFSPETDALFILLILSTLMQASIVGNVLSQLLGMGNPLDSLDPAVQGATVIVAFLPIVCLSFAVMTVVLGAAFVFYKRHPSKIRLQKKIFPVTEKDEKLKEKIYQLADQVNIPLPQIEMESSVVADVDADAYDNKVIKDYSRRDGSLKAFPSRRKRLRRHPLSSRCQSVRCEETL